MVDTLEVEETHLQIQPAPHRQESSQTTALLPTKLKQECWRQATFSCPTAVPQEGEWGGGWGDASLPPLQR